MTCCNVIIPNNKISLIYQYVYQFEISKQTIDRAFELFSDSKKNHLEITGINFFFINAVTDGQHIFSTNVSCTIHPKANIERNNSKECIREYFPPIICDNLFLNETSPNFMSSSLFTQDHNVTILCYHCQKMSCIMQCFFW